MLICSSPKSDKEGIILRGGQRWEERKKEKEKRGLRNSEFNDAYFKRSNDLLTFYGNLMYGQEFKS